MRKDEGTANFIQARLFGGRSATDIAVTEMVRSMCRDNAVSTSENIRRVVQNCSRQNGEKMHRMFPKNTHEEGYRVANKRPRKGQ